MGIQIVGSTDTVTTTTSGGSVKITPASINVTGVSTFSDIRITGGTISGVSTAGITTAYIGSVNDGPLAGFRNFIINGNMAISQRGTSFTTINTYNLDRYRTFGGPITHTITQQDSVATYSPSRYALRAARNSGATETNELGIAQGIESQNSYALRGKTVTVSFRARCGANFSSASSSLRIRIFTGTGSDQNPVSMTGMNGDVDQTVTLTTSLQSFAVTGTLSASLTQATVTFAYTATGTAGANDWFEITDVQLEIGNRATPFERRSFGQELALCQRYYYDSDPTGNTVFGYNGNPIVTAATVAVGSGIFPVPMRAIPTVTCPQGADQSGIGNPSVTASQISVNGFVRINSTGSAFSLNGTPLSSRFIASIEL